MEYYNSGYDKAVKPYQPIDTCSPAGNWIEEKRYNKGRPIPSNGGGADSGIGSTGSRKVLCGNWQEEAALAGDMLRIEEEEAQSQRGLASTTHGAIPRSAENPFGASLDVIREVRNGRYAGGFESSPYLTTDGSLAAWANHNGPRSAGGNPSLQASPTPTTTTTTHRADYTTTSSDVRSQRRPPLGVRGQLQLEQSLAAAREAQAEALARTAQRQAMHSQRSGRGGATTMLAGPATLDANSIYAATISAARAHESTSHDKEVIDGLRQEYLSDEPITLYTGNPENGRTMTVHGRTPVDPMSSTRFGLNTQFSESKYAL